MSEESKGKESIKFNSNKYKLIIDNANDLVCILNKEFKYEYVNSAYQENLGYSPLEIMGKSALIDIHPEDRNNTINILNKGFREGQGITEFRYRHKDGHWIWIESKGTTFVDEEGQTKGLIISRDITKYKEMISKLENSEKKYKEVVDHLFDVVMKTDLQGRIEYTNPQISKDYGYNEEDIIGTKLFEYVHPDDLPEILINFKKVLGGDEKISLKYRVKKKNGDYAWVIAKGKLLEEDGETKLMGTMRYIDEQMQALEKLEESKNRYKEIFEGSRDGFVMVNKDSRIIDANQAFCNMLQYSLEELKQLNDFYQITPNKWHEWEKKEIWEKQLLQKGYSGIYEKEYKRKNGEIFPVELQSYAVRDNDNKIKYLWGIARDITEKKLDQKKIEDSQKRLKQKTEEQQLLLDNIQTQVWYLIDPVTYGKVNKSHAIFNGVKKETLEFKNIYDILPKDVANVCKEGNVEVFSKKKQIKTEEWAPNYKGEKRLLSIIKTPKLNDEGGVDYVVCSAEDITDQKRNQNKLEESQKRLRLFIDSSPDMFFLKDKNLRYLLVNEANARFFGRQEETIVGKTDFELMDANAAEGCEETDRRAIDEKIAIKGIETANGRIYETRKIPVIEKNEVIGVAGIIRDITERRKAEMELKESRQKYREIAELLPDIIYEADLKGNIKYVNSIGFEKFGYSEEELKNGINIFDLITKEYKQKALKNIEKIVSGEKIGPSEYLVKRKDGTPFYARINSIPVIKNNRAIGIRGTVSDIDKMIIAQEKIKESEKKLKTLNRLKSELLSRTSHELKTPLVSIKGFTNLLLELHSEELNPEALQIVNEINDGCIRLENLVNDILNTAKLESRKVIIRKERVNIADLIKRALKSLIGILESREQSISVQISTELITEGDRDKLLEVIENLLLNAIKYTPTKGMIEVNSKIIGKNIVLSIKDNGIGFTTEEKKNLFTQFGKIERYGEGYDIDIDGSGLGLYISKKIIELHGGEIWMDSEGRNKGSTFYFSLPLIE